MAVATLSTFIRQNNRPILSEWEAFARTLAHGAALDDARLRDHAEAMLDEIASALDARPQSTRDVSSLARACDDELGSGAWAAATEHGHDRADSGFTVVDMVAEFRALRASVARLWIGKASHFTRADMETLIRFHEAIDRAIGDSMARYAHDIDDTRERFLAILSHDLRNPLGAITTSASFLAEIGAPTPAESELVRMIQRAAARMNRLVGDMLELALHRFGDSMPIRRGGMNIGELVNAVVNEVRAFYPSASIVARADGNLAGSWDDARLAQALTNLVGNAVQHGDAGQPVRVRAHGDESEVTIEVRNSGRPLPTDQLRRILRATTPATHTDGDRRHLGLGLFIANKIVAAHGGSIDIDAANAETTFTIHLPRAA